MLSSGAMTNRLDRLENAGYIERKPHPKDRRGILVTLTNQGMEVIDLVVVSHTACEQQILSSLTSDEQKVLADLLRKILLSFGDAPPSVS
jgi:DNA-binding MarR family transcriptional regulator